MRRREHPDKSFYRGNVELSELADSLNTVYRTVDENGLGEGVPEKLEREIKVISEVFGISRNAAFLLPCIVERSLGNGCDADDLSDFVGCSNIEFLGYFGCLDEMEGHGVISHSNRGGGREFYYVTREAGETIEKGVPFKPFPMTGLSADEFFTRFRIFISDLKNDNIGPERLLELMSKLVRENQQLLFCRRVLESGLLEDIPPTEQRIFFYLCHRWVSFSDESTAIGTLVQLSERMEDDQLLRRTLAKGRSAVQRSGLVTFGGDAGYQDPESLSLSEEVRSTFFTEVTIDAEKDARHPDLVPASDIVERNLFYNARETGQMERLASLLSPDNFRGVQQRLQEMGMRKGFAVLFSGGAGCGKTAGVYELARRTGRDVFAVDMSQLKSKWVGDSEKIVKGVFDTYRRMCRRKENAPILLFNEADAIFAKRMENPRDSVDQMMNAIQNICLDAIENLDGILIATTNLAGNFCDEAFARRFIFKVEFSTPEAAIRSRIWKSMVDTLSDEDAAVLGRDYTFSGGNIENIARKSAVGYVLSGRKAGLDELRRYCDEEMISSQRQVRKIGF